jgi:hypothetical protein
MLKELLARNFGYPKGRWLIRVCSTSRACGEQAFRVIKQSWGLVEARYRGLAQSL